MTLAARGARFRCTSYGERYTLMRSARPPGKSGSSTVSIAVTTPSLGETSASGAVGGVRVGSRKKWRPNAASARAGTAPSHAHATPVAHATTAAIPTSTAAIASVTTTSASPARARPSRGCQNCSSSGQR